MKQKIFKTQLPERLGKLINAPVTVEDISTLIYGWTRNDNELRVAINHRQWLFGYEVQALSLYAGYNLLMDENNDFT